MKLIISKKRLLLSAIPLLFMMALFNQISCCYLNQKTQTETATENTQPENVTEINWYNDMNEAKENATLENKLILVDFYTEWCGWCKEMDKKVYSDDKVLEIIKKSYIPLKIDGDKNSDLVNKYGISGYPTTLILDKYGNELKRVVGYAEATNFSQMLEEQASK